MALTLRILRDPEWALAPELVKRTPYAFLNIHQQLYPSPVSSGKFDWQFTILQPLPPPKCQYVLGTFFVFFFLIGIILKMLLY